MATTPVSRTPLCYVRRITCEREPTDYNHTACLQGDQGAIPVFPKVEKEHVTVSADALRQLLQALNGPGHYLRELQVTRGPLVGDDNPINILVEQYNTWVVSVNDKE